MGGVLLIERGFEEFSATIMFLDGRGDIVYTDRSWWASADTSDYASNPDSTGVNYLAVCDMARGTDKIAGIVANDICAAPRGDRDLFTAEYPCHSPAVYRRFALRVVPISMPRHGSFTFISHLDITDRWLAELQVSEKNEHLAAPAGMLVSELKAQLTSATASTERPTAVDGNAAMTLFKSPSRVDPLVEWGIAVAG